MAPVESNFAIDAVMPADMDIDVHAGAEAVPGEADTAPAGNFSSLALLHAPEPPYPARAKRLGWQGEVLLRIHVGADGAPREVRIVRSSGHRRLDQAAVAAVRRWRFEPALRDGRAVPGEVQVPVAFAPEVR